MTEELKWTKFKSNSKGIKTLYEDFDFYVATTLGRGNCGPDSLAIILGKPRTSETYQEFRQKLIQNKLYMTTFVDPGRDVLNQNYWLTTSDIMEIGYQYGVIVIIANVIWDPAKVKTTKEYTQEELRSIRSQGKAEDLKPIICEWVQFKQAPITPTTRFVLVHYESSHFRPLGLKKGKDYQTIFQANELPDELMLQFALHCSYDKDTMKPIKPIKQDDPCNADSEQDCNNCKTKPGENKAQCIATCTRQERCNRPIYQQQSYCYFHLTKYVDQPHAKAEFERMWSIVPPSTKRKEEPEEEKVSIHFKKHKTNILLHRCSLKTNWENQQLEIDSNELPQYSSEYDHMEENVQFSNIYYVWNNCKDTDALASFLYRFSETRSINVFQPIALTNFPDNAETRCFLQMLFHLDEDRSALTILKLNELYHGHGLKDHTITFYYEPSATKHKLYMVDASRLKCIETFLQRQRIANISALLENPKYKIYIDALTSSGIISQEAAEIRGMYWTLCQKRDV
jgi:hypothetical protein